MRKRNCWLFAKSDRFFDPDNLSEVFTASWLARRFAMQEIPPAIISISWSLRTCW
ncbi:hypothetical protein M3O75_29475 [Klebsiella pneumoniae]|nr:hypothetical protein [Klebsiella pneumoniae]